MLRGNLIDSLIVILCSNLNWFNIFVNLEFVSIKWQKHQWNPRKWNGSLKYCLQLKSLFLTSILLETDFNEIFSLIWNLSKSLTLVICWWFSDPNAVNYQLIFFLWLSIYLFDFYNIFSSSINLRKIIKC